MKNVASFDWTRLDCTQAVETIATVDGSCGAGCRLFSNTCKEKRTGQDSQKKSQGGNISPIWGEAPSVPIRTKICMVGSFPDVITYAKFQVEIFRGYDFTGGQISHFPIDF